MQDVCDDFGVTLVEFNGEAEHVYLLVEYPPTVQVSRLVNSLKGVSSRPMRRDFHDLVRHYWRAKRLWSEFYYVASWLSGSDADLTRAEPHFGSAVRHPHLHVAITQAAVPAGRGNSLPHVAIDVDCVPLLEVAGRLLLAR